MTEDCITKYGSRKDDPSTPPEKPHYEILCKCGHLVDNHKGVIWKKECETCMCQKFDKLGVYTWEQILKLKICDKND